jgi:hypothetical protein
MAALGSPLSAEENRRTGDIDYSTYTPEIVVRPFQVAAFTGQVLSTAQSLRGMGVDPSNGDLIYLSSRQKVFTGTDVPSRLVRVNVSNPASPIFQTILTEPQLLAAANDGDPTPATSLSSNALQVSPTGIIYFSNFEGTDEILRIVPGSPTTIQKLREENGVSSMFLNNEGNLAIMSFTQFGSPADKFFTIPPTGGPETLLVDYNAIKAVTLATEAKLISGTQLSNGDYIVWDEQFRGGSDQLLRIKPNGDVSIEIAFADLDNGIAGGLEPIVAADDDTLFLLSQFPASGPTKLFIYPQPTDINTRTVIPLAEIGPAVGFQLTPRATVGSTATYSPDPQTTYYYMADLNIGFMWRLTFRTPVPPALLGDINGDEVLNVADVTQFGNLLAANTPPDPAVGDVNGDESVNEADVAELSALIVND